MLGLDRQAKINVLGAGPAGLTIAVALASPRAEVHVYEQRDSIAGGQGLFVHFYWLKAIQETLHLNSYDSVAMRFEQQEIAMLDVSPLINKSDTFCAIERSAFLKPLEAKLLENGGKITYGSNKGENDLDGLRDADLFLAADGPHSMVREHHAEHFPINPQYTHTSTDFYTWFHVKREPGQMEVKFILDEKADDILYAAAYPSSKGIYTVVCNIGKKGWKYHDLEEHQEDGLITDNGYSAIESTFEKILGTSEIIKGKSRWQHFDQFATESIQHENIVLLGDADGPTHPSHGAGMTMKVNAALDFSSQLLTNETLEEAIDAHTHGYRADYLREEYPKAMKRMKAIERMGTFYREICGRDLNTFYKNVNDFQSDPAAFTL